MSRSTKNIKKNKDDDKKSKKSELVREVYDVINQFLKIATQQMDLTVIYGRTI